MKFTTRNKFTRVKTARGRKLSSKNWLQRHFNDPYVHQAKVDGYRARSAYKLVEINDKFKILHNKKSALDLGAAPGGWSQVLVKHNFLKIIAVDLLPIDPFEGVVCIEGDFLEDETKNLIHTNLKTVSQNAQVDLIISDIAPNMTGHQDTDHLRIMNVCESIFEFQQDVLKPGGDLVLKIFQGSLFVEFLNQVKQQFAKVNVFKPGASRSSSSEIYIVARDKKVKLP